MWQYFQSSQRSLHFPMPRAARLICDTTRSIIQFPVSLDDQIEQQESYIICDISHISESEMGFDIIKMRSYIYIYIYKFMPIIKIRRSQDCLICHVNHITENTVVIFVEALCKIRALKPLIYQNEPW